MFKIRTTPVEPGNPSYFWNVASQYQCTWYGYGRAQEVGFTPPCWYDRQGQIGSYTNAKEWLKNYRDPWEVKGADYIPVAGDIAVFTGTYGHIQFLETDTMYSEYASGNKDSFKTGTFTKKSNLLGFLHYPYNVDVRPVPRNENLDQIKTENNGLRIRLEPFLDAPVSGHVLDGYYNVYGIKDPTDEDKSLVDGLKCWYKLAEDRWCANVTTVYLPKTDNEIVRQLEEWVKSMTILMEEKEKENQSLKEKLNEIRKICE